VPRKVVIRPKAEADLGDIWSHTVREWSETQAVAYLEGLDAAIRLLADFPEIARLREEFTPPVRIYTYRSHVIVFLADDQTLEIIRVPYARSNWRALLSE